MMLFERRNTLNLGWNDQAGRHGRSQSFQPGAHSNGRYPERSMTLDRPRKNKRSFSRDDHQEQRHRPRINSSQSLDFFPEFDGDDDDDVTPWDSVSMASSRNDRDDCYTFEEDEAFEDPRSHSNSRRMPHRQDKGYPRKSTSTRSALNLRKLASRGAARNRLNSLNRGKEFHDDSGRASTKLLSCIDSLDQLSQRLEKVTTVSSEIGQFRNVSEPHETEYQERRSMSHREDRQARGSRFQDDEHFRRSKTGYEPRERQMSYDSSDSGVSFSRGYPPQNFENNPSQFPRTSASQQLRPQTNAYNERLSQRPPSKNQRHAEENSSGYSSESNSQNNTRVGHFEQRNSSFPNGPRRDYPYPNPNQEPWYDSESLYSVEDLYGYGTFGYASSSVCDEELPQNNGWFYLPSHQNNRTPPQSQITPPHSQAALPQSQMAPPQSQAAPPHFLATPPGQHNTFPQQKPYYGPTLLNYPNPQLPTSNLGSTTTPAVGPYQQSWPGFGYGSLTGKFLTETNGVSPLGVAISASCAKNYGENEENAIGAMQGHSEYMSPVSLFDSSEGPEGRKRKSVRFSQTVQERIETTESEIEDKTSVIKGENNERQTEISAPLDPLSNNQPVYNVPTGLPAFSPMFAGY